MAANNTTIHKSPTSKLKMQEKEKEPKKKFPKITLEKDLPEEKKKPPSKKNQEENISPEVTTPLIPPALNDKVQLVAQAKAPDAIQEIAMPVVSQIRLMKDRGITKTYFFIESKTFGEVEVSLTMYDTAPHSFHFQLYGNQKLQEISQARQNALQASIKENLPKITLHMAPPLLRKKDRFVTTANKNVAKSKKPSYSKVDGSKNL